MKKIFLAIVLLFICLKTECQVTNYRLLAYGKLSGGMIDSSAYVNFGFSAEYMLFKRIGLNYNLEFQHRKDNYNHFHGSIGSVGGPAIIGLGLAAALANSAGNNVLGNSGIGFKGVLIGLLVFVMPDGVSYHFPIGYKGDLSPYANVLGFDWIRNREKGYSEFKYSCSFGVRGTYLINDRMTAIGFIETRKAAPTGWGIGAGIGLGYLFKLRENDTQNNPN